MTPRALSSRTGVRLSKGRPEFIRARDIATRRAQRTPYQISVVATQNEILQRETRCGGRKPLSYPPPLHSSLLSRSARRIIYFPN